MELDVLAAAGEIGVDRLQDAAGGFGWEAGERQARNDAVGFLKTVFFQIYIDFFGIVADDNQTGVSDALQFTSEVFFNFKTKKHAIFAHFFENFFGDDS